MFGSFIEQLGRAVYDGIYCPSHSSANPRPQMSMINRAAQFSPFAALTGYNAVIKETGAFD